MLIRPNTILAATFGSLSASSSSSPSSACISNTSCHTTSTRPPPKRRRRCLQCQRSSYATATGNNHSGDAERPLYNERHRWPTPPTGQTCPTPYQIFALKHHELYTKARFYELVKMYHPDRSTCDDTISEPLPRHVKIERYRLIVAAHTILSDPAKRSAYDRFGAGWHGRPDFNSSQSSSSSSSSSSSTARSDPAGPFTHNWSDPSDPIWQNATWEDWERFHARSTGEGKQQQSPLYLQNSSFIALVALVALLGGSMNYTSAHSRGQNFVEKRDIVHDRAAKELRRVRMEKQAAGTRADRVEWFVRQRDATLGVAGSDPAVLREEVADRVLPRRDICRSEETVQRRP